MDVTLNRALHIVFAFGACAASLTMNVLNVIKSKKQRTQLLNDIWTILSSQKYEFNKYPPVYFTCHEKDGTGKADETQTNMMTEDYIPEIVKNFPDTFEVSLKDKVITVKSSRSK